MIYLDNGATTKISNEALDAYNKLSTENYFNSAALYGAASVVLSHISAAREQVAAGLNASAKDIVFTSGGTESNNLAIKGFLAGQRKGRIICGGAEHDSVYNIFKSFENGGVFEVVFAPVDRYGATDKEKLRELVASDTVFVSVMHVSNETGAINDIEEIVKIVKSRAPACRVHCDGVQAYGKVKIDLRKFGCDLYSVSAHKHHGPKGVGALYISPQIKLKPLLHGGGHEGGIRSGTHNAPAIAAYGKAAELAISGFEVNNKQLMSLKEYLYTTISDKVVDIMLNSGTNSDFAPHLLSVSFKNVPAEVLVTILETKGIIVGTGSACSAKKGYSRVHQAMGIGKEYSGGTVRFGFSHFNTMEEIEYTARCVIDAVKELRRVCKK